MELNELNELLERLNDNNESWNLSIGNSYIDGKFLYATRVTVDGFSYSAIEYTPENSIVMAVETALGSKNEEYNEEELENASAVLKATLDELGFDRAVALLERLNNL